MFRKLFGLDRQAPHSPTLLDHVVPRIKTPEFRAAAQQNIRRLNPSLPEREVDDSLPVVRDFVGDLVIAYAIDDGPQFRFVNQREFAGARVDVEQLHSAAVRNLGEVLNRVQPDMQQEDALVRVSLPDTLTATLMLDESFWEGAHETLGATLFVGVPHRDVLLIGPASDQGLGAVAAAIDATEWTDPHGLSRHLFMRAGGKWTAYGRASPRDSPPVPTGREDRDA